MKLESGKCCCWTISIYFFYSFFKTIINCFKGLPTAVTVIENASNVALVCMMIVAILSIIRRMDRRTILFLFVVALLLVLNILIYETVPPRYSEYMRTFSMYSISYPYSVCQSGVFCASDGGSRYRNWFFVSSNCCI